MSSIYEHRSDDESDYDDEDFYYNTDHVEMNIQLGTHDDYSNDLSDDNEEFPMPQTLQTVPLPVPMPQSQLITEVPGSPVVETRNPADSDWDRNSADSLSVSSTKSRHDLEKELDELRAKLRSLSKQPEKHHEKLVPMPPHVQRPSTGMPFDTRGLTAPAVDNTPRGPFSNHDQHQTEPPNSRSHPRRLPNKLESTRSDESKRISSAYFPTGIVL